MAENEAKFLLVEPMHVDYGLLGFTARTVELVLKQKDRGILSSENTLLEHLLIDLVGRPFTLQLEIPSERWLFISDPLFQGSE